MSRIHVRLPDFNGVAAGQTARARVPVGRRYHKLFLTFGGLAAFANLEQIRVYANGKEIHRYSAVQLNTMNLFDKLATASGTSGTLTIPFDRNNLRTVAGEEETALNTGVRGPDGVAIESVDVEVDIASGATAPTLSLSALVSDAIEGGPGTVRHIRPINFTVGGSGDFDVDNFPYGGSTTMALNRVAFVPSANDISNIVVERNNRTIFERSKTLNELIQTDGYRAPQSGYIIVDRTEDGRGGDPIDFLNATDFRFRLTASGAMTLTAIFEYLGALGD